MKSVELRREVRSCEDSYELMNMLTDLRRGLRNYEANDAITKRNTKRITKRITELPRELRSY